MLKFHNIITNWCLVFRYSFHRSNQSRYQKYTIYVCTFIIYDKNIDSPHSYTPQQSRSFETFPSVPERKLSRRRLVGFLSLPRHSGCENARVTGSEFACSSLGGSGIGSSPASHGSKHPLATIAKNRLASILMDSLST